MLNFLAVFYWVGVSDIGNRKGMYKWTDGATMSEDFWGPGNPKTYFGRTMNSCGYLNSSTGKLSDSGCGSLWSILCEVKKKDLQCAKRRRQN
jgi:hypothetical protein